MTYRIVRFYSNPDLSSKDIRLGVTLEEAQGHCNNPETSSKTCTSAEAKAHTEKYGDWFDGYREES